MKKMILVSMICILFGCTKRTGVQKDYSIQPVPFTQVKLTEGFWYNRTETNRKVTIPYNFKKCEETGRISNFAKAGGLEEWKEILSFIPIHSNSMENTHSIRVRSDDLPGLIAPAAR